MPTLILPPRYTEDSIRLWRAAGEAGWTTQRLRGWRVDAPIDDDQLAIYGEPLFALAVAEQLEQVLLEAPLDWLCRLPKRYVKRDNGFATLADFESLSYPTFLKPADDKCFPARVYQAAGDVPVHEPESYKIPVLFSEPAVWPVEFRAFVRDGEVRTMSVYSRYGELIEGADPAASAESDAREARRFLEEMLVDAGVEVPPAVVVDVGMIEDVGWAVVESNPAWGAGIYSCDPVDVIETLDRACIPRAQLTDEDKRWVVLRPSMA